MNVKVVVFLEDVVLVVRVIVLVLVVVGVVGVGVVGSIGELNVEKKKEDPKGPLLIIILND